LPRAPFPVIAVFRQTLRCFDRTIGDEVGIKHPRAGRIVSNTERRRARGKT